MLCKSKSLSFNWLRERICKSKIQWVPNEPRDIQYRSDIFYMLLNNSVFSENDSSFQVEVLIHGCSAALQKAQRLLHLCLCCSKWQIFGKEARIEINDLQLMIRCYLSPDSKKPVARGWRDDPPFCISFTYTVLRQFLHLSVGRN